MAWVFVCTDGAANTVQMYRVREDLERLGGGYSDQDVIKNFTKAEWLAAVALNTALTGATVRITETLPFPKTGER